MEHVLDELKIKQVVSILALIVLLLTSLTILNLLMCGGLSLYEFCIRNSRTMKQNLRGFFQRVKTGACGKLEYKFEAEILNDNDIEEARKIYYLWFSSKIRGHLKSKWPVSFIARITRHSHPDPDVTPIWSVLTHTIWQDNVAIHQSWLGLYLGHSTQSVSNLRMATILRL